MTADAARLDELATLQDDWDTYGGAPPAKAALQVARRLLATIHASYGGRVGRRSSPTHIAPLPSGGVQLEWAAPFREIEVEVGADGELAYLLIDGLGDQRQFTEGEEVPTATIVELVVGVLASRVGAPTS